MRDRLRELKRRGLPWLLAAPPYLLALYLLRAGDRDGWPFLLASAAGVLAFACALADFVSARRGGVRVPPADPLLIWGGVVAMELHAAFLPIAGTRIVPAALCYVLGYRLPPLASIPFAVGAAAWLAGMTPRTGGRIGEFASIGALAVLAFAAGFIVRRSDLRRAPDMIRARETIARSRSLVLPWEEPRSGGGPSPAAATEETVLLRRERELADGIQRALEGLLPMTGAEHVAYLSQSPTPGSSRYDGILASRRPGAPREFSVPDTYVPVREAVVFRRPFIETGPEALRYAPWTMGAEGRVTGIAAVPVFREDAVEGVLLAVREEEGGWADSVPALIEFVARFIGRDIERIRAAHHGERYLLREDWYHRMVRKMAQVGGAEDGEPEESLPLRRQRVYAEAVGQVRRQAGASRVLLIGTDDAGKTGWIAWEETGSPGGGSEQPETLGESYVGWVIRTGSQRIFSDTIGTSRSQGVLPSAWRKGEERSFLLFPVAGVGEFRGAVVCTHGEAKRFDRHHAEIVRDITEVMQLGLSHVERLEALTKRAATDGLTGLTNRKTFLDALGGELARLDGRHPCAVVMMDIDHFKRINDTHGHPFGDEVLRRVASVLGKAVRKGDAVGRYGGEEFILYLHLADPDKAREGAERFRRMIRQTKFLHEGREVAVTASFGISCAPQHGTASGDLLKRADEALYLSKQRGRDRVTVYPG